MFLSGLKNDLPRRSLVFEAVALPSIAAMILTLAVRPAAGVLLPLAAVPAAAVSAVWRKSAIPLCIALGLVLGWGRAEAALLWRADGRVRDARPARVIEREKLLAPGAEGGVIERARFRILGRIEAVYRPPVSSWVAGLLLGDDSGFSRRWREVFRRTGTSHLTAVSGYNVFLVLEACKIAVGGLPFGRRTRLFIGALLVGFFVLLTGSPASVLRAAAMAYARTIAEVFGRYVRPLRALLIALVVMSFADPFILIDDLGFQLSALAAFGIAAASAPLAETVFGRWPKPVAGPASEAAAAGVATAPLIAWKTGTYSLVSLAANVAVSVFIPPLMIGGAALTALGFVSLPQARLFAGAAEWFFAAPLVVLRLSSRLPLSLLQGLPAAVALAAAEAFILAWVFIWRKRVGRRHFL